MVAVQPIPRNTPSSSDVEAQAVLAVHTKGTKGRPKPPKNAPVQHGTVPGEASGSKVGS